MADCCQTSHAHFTTLKKNYIMDYDEAISFLQGEINAFPHDDIFSVEALEPTFSSFPDKRKNLAYYLILCTNHGLTDLLGEDPVIGFLMLNNTLLDLSKTIKALKLLNLGDVILECMKYGPFGLTMKLHKELANETKTLEMKCSLVDAFATKLVKFLHKGEKKLAAVVEPYFLSAMKDLTTKIDDNNYGTVLKNYLVFLNKFIPYCFDSNCIDKDLELLYGVGEDYIEEPRKESIFKTPAQVLDFLIAILEEKLKPISIVTWMSWGEDHEQPNLQTEIGNELYKVSELLSKYNVSTSERLLSCLNQMKIKPITEEEIIASKSVSELYEGISTGNVQNMSLWYNALCDKEDAWSDETIILVLLEEQKYAKNVKDVVLKSMEFFISKKFTWRYRVFFKAMESLESSIQMEIFKKFIAAIPLTDSYSSEVHPLITIVLNKFSTNSDIDDIIRTFTTLVIQNPIHAFRHVFQLVTTSKENHALCEKILNAYNPVLEMTLFYDDELNQEIRDVTMLNYLFQKILNESHTDKEWQNLIDFCNMAFKKPCTFMYDCCISSLEDKLSKEDWNGSKYVMMMLKSIIIYLKEAGNSIEVLMVFLGQVLVQCSWDARSFDAGKADAYQVCCDVIADIELDGLESVWLIRHLSRLPNHSQTLFCDLWLSSERIYPKPAKAFLCLLIAARTKSIEVRAAMRKHFQSGNASLELRIFSALFKILPVIHCNEWFKIFDVCCEFLPKQEEDVKLTVSKLFSRTMIMFSKCWNVEMEACFKYCIQNLNMLFKKILEEKQWSFEEKVCLFKFLVTPLSNVPASAKDGCYFLMLPVLLKCVKISGDNEDSNVVLPFLNSVDETWRDKFREALKTP